MHFDAQVHQMWEDIKQLKKERNAVILAHYYQRPEVQEIADYVGDSLELSRQAANTNADVIVFCGVHFMAESAAILSPDKTVILPVEKAGCAMADMVTAESLRAKKKEMPGAVVVTYVNSSAEVKAESDICCTSANAVKIIQSIPEDREILFVPDRNLGRYAAKQANREVVVWAGQCPVHDEITIEDVVKAKEQHPGAKLIVHPECPPEVADLADFVSSTSGLLRFARESEHREFIVGTEEGILHQLVKENPHKKFYILHQRKMVCPDMKYTTLPKLKESLENMNPQVSVPEGIRAKALKCLERMLNVK
ncbi:quinolinate synthase [Desulfohalotomaculum tongense]|uniref:quinolinate synthase NadA n=1 Tax=Desulforadius tongensis TaxID=1216062 RepID=UPI00195B5FB0|nr:quinolinate synthase NadA [Desulforadius tongensis]MBM7856036.1 quinolinate synthase [Desulforadius tongensis]